MKLLYQTNQALKTLWYMNAFCHDISISEQGKERWMPQNSRSRRAAPQQACLLAYQLPLNPSVQNQRSLQKWKIIHISITAWHQELPHLLLCSRRKPPTPNACLPSPFTSTDPEGHQQLQACATGAVTPSSTAGSRQAHRAPSTAWGQAALNDQAEHATVPGWLFSPGSQVNFQKDGMYNSSGAQRPLPKILKTIWTTNFS